MGLLSKLKGKTTDPTKDDFSSITTTDSATFSTDPLNPSASTSSETPRKKSLYEKYQDRKRGQGTSNMTDEELLKYTGKTREEFESFKATTPGVAGGQAAGDIMAGGNSGIGTSAGVGEGMGGWGMAAGKVPKDRIVR